MTYSTLNWSMHPYVGFSSCGLTSRSTVGTIQTERPRSAGLAVTPESQLCSEDLEDLYQRLGRTRGPFGTRQGREATGKAWETKEWAGALWLLDRVRRERHLDVLDAVAETLAAHRDRVIPTVVGCFTSSSTGEHDYQAMLLRAAKLARTSGREDARLVAMASEGARSPDAEVREAAYLLLGAIGSDAAQKVLRDALRAEQNDAARETAREALEG